MDDNDNYSNDGPDFVKSLEYLNDGKKKFNESVDLLLLDLAKVLSTHVFSKVVNLAIWANWME